jgi:hypothetical protein
MVTSNTHGGRERVRSLELLADEWGLSSSEGRTAA